MKHICLVVAVILVLSVLQGGQACAAHDSAALNFTTVLSDLKKQNSDLADAFEQACLIYFAPAYVHYIGIAQAGDIRQAVADANASWAGALREDAQGEVRNTFVKSLYQLTNDSRRNGISRRRWLAGDRFEGTPDATVSDTLKQFQHEALPQPPPAADLGWQWWTNWPESQLRAEWVLRYAVHSLQDTVQGSFPRYNFANCPLTHDRVTMLTVTDEVLIVAFVVNDYARSAGDPIAQMLERYLQQELAPDDFGKGTVVSRTLVILLQSMYPGGVMADLLRKVHIRWPEEAGGGSLGQVFEHIAATAGRAPRLPFYPPQQSSGGMLHKGPGKQQPVAGKPAEQAKQPGRPHVPPLVHPLLFPAGSTAGKGRQQPAYPSSGDSDDDASVGSGGSSDDGGETARPPQVSLAGQLDGFNRRLIGLRMRYDRLVGGGS